MVNPGRTGTPRLVISARLAPLPPSTLFMSRAPSAAPEPKKNTDLPPPDFRASAPAAKAELVGVCWWRGGVVTREACVAEPVRAVRDRLEHPVERAITESVDSKMLANAGEVEIRRHQLLACKRV